MRRSEIRAGHVRRAYPKLGEGASQKTRQCLDGCGKTVSGKAAFASAACRKRYQRARDDKSVLAKGAEKVKKILEKKPTDDVAAVEATAATDTPPEANK